MPKDQWISKTEAMQRYGISNRQLQRYMADGRIRRRVLPPETGQTVGLVAVSLEDMQRYQRGELPAAAVVPAVMGSGTPRPVPQLAAPAGSRDPEEEPGHYTAEPRRPPRAWCSIAEAALWCGLPQKWIREGCLSGAVVALNAGSASRAVWRVHRDSLARSSGAREWRDQSKAESA